MNKFYALIVGMILSFNLHAEEVKELKNMATLGGIGNLLTSQGDEGILKAMFYMGGVFDALRSAKIICPANLSNEDALLAATMIINNSLEYVFSTPYGREENLGISASDYLVVGFKAQYPCEEN